MPRANRRRFMSRVRVYVQVCVRDLHILSPSAAMSLLLADRENRGQGGQGGQTTEEERRPGPGSRGSEGVREETPAEERCGPGSKGAGEKNPDEERPSENTSVEGGGRNDTEKERRDISERGRKRKGKRVREEEGEEEEERSERGGAAVEEAEQSGGGGDTKRRRTGEQGGAASPSEQGLMGREAEPPSSDPCVSLVFRVDSKQGVALRNHQLSSCAAPGLSLSFVATATCLGRAQGWERDPRNAPPLERELGAPCSQVTHCIERCR